MYFAEKEMLCRYDYRDVPADVYANLMDLRDCLNVLGQHFLPPRVLTCAYRNLEHNARVGGAKRSTHLTGNACDIADADGKLKAFLRANPTELIRARLWAEDYAHTPTWVHLQRVPPRSGVRVFKP